MSTTGVDMPSPPGADGSWRGWVLLTGSGEGLVRSAILARGEGMSCGLGHSTLVRRGASAKDTAGTRLGRLRAQQGAH